MRRSLCVPSAAVQACNCWHAPPMPASFPSSMSSPLRARCLSQVPPCWGCASVGSTAAPPGARRAWARPRSRWRRWSSSASCWATRPGVCQGFTAAHPGRAGPGEDRAVARDAGVPAPAAGHPGALPGRRAAHHARPLEARAGDLDAHGAPPALCLTHPARPAAMLLHFRVRVLRFTRQGPLACCDDRRVHTACG